MRVIVRIFTLLILFACNAIAQSSYVPLGSYTMHVLDRMEIKQGFLAEPSEFNTTTKAYLRYRIADFALKIDSTIPNLSPQDRFNCDYLKIDNFEYSHAPESKSKKQFKNMGIYREKAALYSVQIPDFDLIVNPVLYLRGEYDSKRNDRLPYFVNRGLNIRGRIGKHISFFTEVAEEIQSLNWWNLDYYLQNGVLAGQNFINTNTFKPNDSILFSYWNASGYIAFQAGKYFDLQFGHGKNFIGNGYRSLMRSDFSTNNLFFRANTRIWKINYTNIYGYLYDYVPLVTRADAIKQHYYATTYANVNVTKNLNIGLFETTVFSRDSGYEHTGYDLQYLNPIIFYNAIDNGRNSPDKNILGIDFKYNFLKKYQLYGQFVLSEMNIFKRLTQPDWWGQKEAYQIGAKLIDFLGVNNLDIQIEYNQARPYSYTSFNPKNAYVNYRQSMAHPLGANFREGLTIIKYQPTNKLFLNTLVSYSIYGNDTNGSNWGKNIALSYDSRMREFGNFIGQGVATSMLIIAPTASYMLKHNFFIDLQLSYRSVKSKLAIFESEMLNLGVAIRWNINMRECNY